MVLLIHTIYYIILKGLRKMKDDLININCADFWDILALFGLFRSIKFVLTKRNRLYKTRNSINTLHQNC